VHGETSTDFARPRFLAQGFFQENRLVWLVDCKPTAIPWLNTPRCMRHFVKIRAFSGQPAMTTVHMVKDFDAARMSAWIDVQKRPFG
jgi:hypothetical protein